MEFRRAVQGDLDDIMELVRQAKAFMKSCGLDQWQEEYPERRDFEDDISRGFCHVLTDDGECAAVVTICDIPEQAYGEIRHGKWLTEKIRYAVIHRSAVGEGHRGKGIGSRLMSYSEKIALDMGCVSIRVDTHADNAPMRKTLEKSGYSYCGRVFLGAPGDTRLERVAYEKVIGNSGD